MSPTDPTGLAALAVDRIIHVMRRFGLPGFGAYYVALICAAVVVTTATAQLAPGGSAPSRELLNSERIQAAFGSYAIEVLETTALLRVSSLQSLETGGPICRTFAVVRYPDAIDPALADEHGAIVSGGSIGAVFAASGWTIRKTHLHYGTMPAGSRAARLMAQAPGTAVAVHVYLFEVAKDGRSFPYATIAELHHPEYLTEDALRATYGPADATGKELLLAAMLETAAEEGGGPDQVP